MTPDPVPGEIQPQNTIPSTAGMTTKVVKGSLWTLGGQVLPMAVALVATPFTIRFLGSEGYGVLILVGLIPTYFAFADFGMGIASTKFASEAYAEGKPEKEGEIVRTAALIALLCSLVFAVPIFLFSWPIVTAFNVPEAFQSAANIALRISSAAFVLGILSSVLNTPMLARLRMDLNTLTNTVPKVLMAVVTPVVLYLGVGVVGAVWVAFFAAVATILVTTYFSGRLLPALFRASINKVYWRPLVKFGAGWIVGMIAAILLVNFEKLALAKMVSVRSLAYYSVAFTFASIATTFSQAMLQSLVPAFSQLLSPEKKDEFDGLFARAIRLNLIWLLPTLMVLFVIAEPFFTIWAGEEFGRESPFPFYILLFGLFFNILAYVPHTTITAKGRTDIFAKLYWVELVFYAVSVVVLISYFGIAGAAAAWSLRVVVDAFIIIWFSKRIAGVPFKFFYHFNSLGIGFLLLLPPVLFAVIYSNFSLWLILLVPTCLGLYSILIWKTFVEDGEREWIRSRIRNFVKI